MFHDCSPFIPKIHLAPELVIPAQAGIQLIKNPRVAGQYQDFVRFAGCFSCWIPAFAGMTYPMNYLSSFNRNRDRKKRLTDTMR
jgi:hypothetical protein